MMTGHFKDNSPIPADLLKNLVASKNANVGGSSLRQIFLATFDLTLHTRGKADTMNIAKDLYREILGIETIGGTNRGANFNHLGKKGYLKQK